MNLITVSRVVDRAHTSTEWILGGIAAMAGPLVFIFLLAKGLRGQAFTKEASLYLVVSAGLLAILLIASDQFSWLDVAVSTAALLPVLLGMSIGHRCATGSPLRRSRGWC